MRLISLLRTHLQYYPSPLAINTSWNLGIFLSSVLILQIVTGIVLAAIYSNSVDEVFMLIHSFQRKDYIDGWLLHYMHIAGSSYLFILAYLHMAMKYPRSRIINPSNWISGLIILLVWMFAAFLGYILPWGQMSYWAATVIVSFFPKKIITLALGNYYLNSLYRVFTFHYLMPIVSAGIVWVHMFYLHQKGSNSVLGYSLPMVNFYPIVLIQDIGGLATLLALFILFTCFITLANPTNTIEVSRFNTPIFIEPEWYFLTYYAILKSVPNIYVGEIIFVYFIIALFVQTNERTWERLKVIVLSALILGYIGISIPSTLNTNVGVLTIIIYSLFI